MALLQIVQIGDPNEEVLFKPAARVRTFGAELHRLLDDMVETMREAPGVGLAAPQVGIGQRIAVVEYFEDDDEEESAKALFEIINPEIIKMKGEDEGQEGCLSIPGYAADVKRATYVLVKAQDRHGKEVRIKAYDWLARIFQHEIDHLHGRLMTDQAVTLYRAQRGADGEIEMIPVEEPPKFRPAAFPLL